jgi:hypothetical protein
MKVERFLVKACCGSTSVTFKIGSPVSKDFLPLLVGNGFIESKHFTAAGLLYVENESLVVTGSFGQSILQIKCKKTCEESINNFEQLLIKWSENAKDPSEK